MHGIGDLGIVRHTGCLTCHAIPDARAKRRLVPKQAVLVCFIRTVNALNVRVERNPVAVAAKVVVGKQRVSAG